MNGKEINFKIYHTPGKAAPPFKTWKGGAGIWIPCLPLPPADSWQRLCAFSAPACLGLRKFQTSPV